MKASEAKFIEFLRKSRQFVIPIYQRTYSWKEREPPAGPPLRDDGSSIESHRSSCCVRCCCRCSIRFAVNGC